MKIPRRQQIQARGVALASTACATATGAQPAGGGADPDAELIRQCAAFDRCEAEISAVDATGLDDLAAEAEAEPLEQQSQALLDQIEAIRAVSAAGILARARTLALHNHHGVFDMNPTAAGATPRLMRALMRDALAVSGLPVAPGLERAGAEPPPPAAPVLYPDAELLSLCAQHDAIQRRIDDALPSGATNAQEQAWEEWRKPLREEQDRLRDRIIALPTATLAGYRARIATLKLFDPDAIHFIEEDAESGGMVVAILRSLTGGAA